MILILVIKASMMWNKKLYSWKFISIKDLAVTSSSHVYIGYDQSGVGSTEIASIAIVAPNSSDFVVSDITCYAHII
jgi:hypothetical protein